MDTTDSTPLVSIGFPVYNGEAFLTEALDSVINQTYKNLEIVICDNASTDSTRDIVERYIKNDERIKYFRHEKNLGAAKNYNSTFDKSQGKYFKWAAHDDVLGINYIELCVSELEKDESLVLIQPRTGQIDENGNITSHEYIKSSDLISSTASICSQYRTLVQRPGAWVRIFGLVRSSALQDSPLIDYYIGSDLTLLGELGLKGKVRDIDSILFWRREHENTSTRGVNAPRRKRQTWFDSSKKNTSIILPEWRIASEMIRSISRQNITLYAKLTCYSAVIGRMWIKKRLLIQDIIFALVDAVLLARAKLLPSSQLN